MPLVIKPPECYFNMMNKVAKTDPQCWLMKSEPDAYSIQNLQKEGKSWWEGVRNYQARNFMTQTMKVGDPVLFYHSSTEPAGVAGLARVCAAAQPDKLQFNKKSEFFDPKATQSKPNWFCVQVEFEKILPHLSGANFVAAGQLLRKALC